MIGPLQRFDVSFQTAYAQAKELGAAQGSVPLATAGSLQVESRGDRRFVYRYRYGADGRRVAEYLGPEDDQATLARVAEADAEIREAATLAGYCRDLRRVGFYAADNSTLLSVASLFNAGIFGGGAVLVGTHAFGVLANDLGLRAAPFPMTDDVDGARARHIQIAALPKGGLLALLSATGLPFHEVRAPATSFKVRGQKLKVDLLVPVPPRGRPDEAVAVPELGAHATALPHLRYLLGDAAESVLLGRDRIVPVRVPLPGRFCLHKLAVYALRGDGAKREKDAVQAALFAAALVDGKEFLLEEAAAAMDRALRARIKPGAKRAIALLGRDHPAAADAMAALA